MVEKVRFEVVLLTHARSKIFNFFHNFNSSLIKMVYYVRLKSISLNCFDILTQEMIFLETIVPFSDYERS